MAGNKTVQRRVILEELGLLKNHPTADELFQVVRIRLPRISLATVYRNLAELVSAGEIRKNAFADGKMRFETKTVPHFHLRCVHCDAIEDLALDAAEVGEFLKNKVTRRVQTFEIHFSGLCRSCSELSRQNGV